MRSARAVLTLTAAAVAASLTVSPANATVANPDKGLYGAAVYLADHGGELGDWEVKFHVKEHRQIHLDAVVAWCSDEYGRVWNTADSPDDLTFPLVKGRLTRHFSGTIDGLRRTLSVGIKFVKKDTAKAWVVVHGRGCDGGKKQMTLHRGHSTAP